MRTPEIPTETLEAFARFSRVTKNLSRELPSIARKVRRFSVAVNRRKPLIHKGRKP